MSASPAFGRRLKHPSISFSKFAVDGNAIESMSPSTSPGSTYHENLCTNRSPRTLDSEGPDRRDFDSPVNTADVRDKPGYPRLQRSPSPAKALPARTLPGHTSAPDSDPHPP